MSLPIVPPTPATVPAVAHEAKSAALDAAGNRWVQRFMRFGYIVRGVIYLVIGLIALRLAFGIRGDAMSQTGAIVTIGHQPFGIILLFSVGVGLAGYSLWSGICAVLDPLHEGHSIGGLLNRQLMRPVGHRPQFLDRTLAQASLLGEELLEDRFGQRRSKLDPGEFVAAPDDPAILGLETRDAEQQPAVGRRARSRFDPASVSRNVDHVRAHPAPAGLAHGRVQIERGSLRTPAFRLTIGSCLRITHGELTLRATLAADGEQKVCLAGSFDSRWRTSRASATLRLPWGDSRWPASS